VAVVGVEGKWMPLTNDAPVVRPSVPPLILSAVVLPIVLLEIVIDAATPETIIPEMLPATEAVVPLHVQAPMVLFWIEMVPVDEELIPTNNPPDVVEVAVNDPVPVVAPMVLPVTVPILASPEVTFIPHNIPLVVVAPLLVVNAIEAMVLF